MSKFALFLCWFGALHLFFDLVVLGTLWWWNYEFRRDERRMVDDGESEA